MTRQEWTRLRRKRPDLKLRGENSFAEGFWTDVIDGCSPEDLITWITADILSGAGPHWSCDFKGVWNYYHDA